MQSSKRLPPIKIALLSCFLLYQPSAVHAEIYKWVDAKGKVHLSDKRSASDKAVRIDAGAPMTSKDGNHFRFTAEADAMLREGQRAAKGELSALSAGYWKSSRSVYELTSIIRFNISDLLAELNTHRKKKIVSAKLQLFANTTDTIHRKNNRSDAAKGHYSLKGDNAFYVKAARNDWDEHNTTWQQYYNESNYTPTSIRTLPSVEVSGSHGDDSKDYEIDLLEMLTSAAKINMRELTLELRSQRRASTSVVSFYSREASQEKKPTLLIQLSEK